MTITCGLTWRPYTGTDADGNSLSGKGFQQYTAVAAGVVKRPWVDAPTVGVALNTVKILPRHIIITAVSGDLSWTCSGTPTDAIGNVIKAGATMAMENCTDFIMSLRLCPRALGTFTTEVFF